LTIRVHEPNGTFDTEVQIDMADKLIEIPYQKRFKPFRKRKRKKRAFDYTGIDMIEALENGEMMDEDDEFAEMNIMKDSDPEQEEADFARSKISWITLDPESEWCCLIKFEQMDYMWMNQLEKDKDILAQYHVIQWAKFSPSLSMIKPLKQLIINDKIFYKLRVDAVSALSELDEDYDWKGVHILLDIYRELFCYQEEGTWIPKAHDFSSLQTYFVQKSIPLAVAQMKRTDGLTPVEVRRFLLDLLRFNDNSGNPFSDNYLVQSFIGAIGDAFVQKASRPLCIWREIEGLTYAEHKITLDLSVGEKAESSDMLVEEFDLTGIAQANEQSVFLDTEDDKDLFKDALAELDRYRILDMVIPTFQNTVTYEILQTMLKWALSEMIPVDLALFLSHSRYGHFESIRKLSFEALLLLDGLTNPKILKYFLHSILEDPCPYMRYYVAHALASFAKIQNVRDEENATTRRFGRWTDVKNMVKDWTESKSLICDILRSSYDHRVRVNVLWICELLFDPITEPVGLKLNLNVTERIFAIDEESSDDEAEIIKLKKSKNYKVAPMEVTFAAPSALPVHTYSSSLQIPTFPSLEDPKELIRIGTRLVERLFGHPNVGPFLYPVDDSVAPGYSKIIKFPMDLSTIRTKLMADSYQGNLTDLMKDVYQIFINCYAYNLDGSTISNQAKSLQNFMEEELIPEILANLARGPGEGGEEFNVSLPELPVINQAYTGTGMPPIDEQICRSLLRKLTTHRQSFWFREPVNPVKQNIPQYLDIIKSPMDFSTVRKKLNQKQYPSLEAFTEDIRLIFSNSYTFNPAHTQVYRDTKVLDEFFTRELNLQTGVETKIEPVLPEAAHVAPKPNVPPPRPLTEEEMQGEITGAMINWCKSFIRKCTAQKLSSWFRTPVSSDYRLIYNRLIL
jgi:transcription initiation factor TFIID subunit 2